MIVLLSALGWCRALRQLLLSWKCHDQVGFGYLQRLRMYVQSTWIWNTDVVHCVIPMGVSAHLAIGGKRDLNVLSYLSVHLWKDLPDGNDAWVC